MVLATYLVTHLLNHALGLVSVAAAEAGRWWFTALWRNPPATLLLYAALLTHPILGLVALHRRAACRAALRGAAGMIAALETLSRGLADELPAPLRLGIDIHVGPAVVGRMGYAEAAYLTAVGDTVHVAARLEELTKTYTSELVISEAVAARAGVDVSGYPREELTLRSRSTALAIRVVADARRLASTMS